MSTALFAPRSIAVPVQQDPGADGLVIIKAEAFDSHLPQEAHSWTDRQLPSYSGTGAMEATPNIGTNNNTRYVNNSPLLDYEIDFVKTGAWFHKSHTWSVG